METFLSLQGEGAYQGELAYFIRVAGCDVGCSWCDVKESWDAEKHAVMSVEDIVNGIDSTAKFVVITGGEPLMYNLDHLCQEIKSKGMRIHLETSGAYPLSGEFDWICLSPKKFKAPLQEVFDKADELKVIAVNKSDFSWGEEQAQHVRSECRLFFQAEWDKKDKMYPLIYSYIAEHPRWTLSLQSHKYLGLP